MLHTARKPKQLRWHLSRNPQLFDECQQLTCSDLRGLQPILKLLACHAVGGLDVNLVSLGYHPGYRVAACILFIQLLTTEQSLQQCRVPMSTENFHLYVYLVTFFEALQFTYEPVDEAIDSILLFGQVDL